MGTFKTMFTLVACVCAAVLCFPERLHAYSLTLAAAGVMQKSSQGAGDSAAKAHIPPVGSPERKDIMDGLRGDQKVVFKVYYLKVHGDWAFVDVTPLDDKGKPVAEGGASLYAQGERDVESDGSFRPSRRPRQPNGAGRPHAEIREGRSESFSGSAFRYLPASSPSKVSGG